MYGYTKYVQNVSLMKLYLPRQEKKIDKTLFSLRCHEFTEI